MAQVTNNGQGQSDLVLHAGPHGEVYNVRSDAKELGQTNSNEWIELTYEVPAEKKNDPLFGILLQFMDWYAFAGWFRWLAANCLALVAAVWCFVGFVIIVFMTVSYAFDCVNAVNPTTVYPEVSPIVAGLQHLPDSTCPTQCEYIVLEEQQSCAMARTNFSLEYRALKLEKDSVERSLTECITDFDRCGSNFKVLETAASQYKEDFDKCKEASNTLMGHLENPNVKQALHDTVVKFRCASSKKKQEDCSAGGSHDAVDLVYQDDSAASILNMLLVLTDKAANTENRAHERDEKIRKDNKDREKRNARSWNGERTTKNGWINSYKNQLYKCHEDLLKAAKDLNKNSQQATKDLNMVKQDLEKWFEAKLDRETAKMKSDRDQANLDVADCQRERREDAKRFTACPKVVTCLEKHLAGQWQLFASSHQCDTTGF